MICFATGVYGIAGIAPGWGISVFGQSKEKLAVAIALSHTFATLAPIYTSFLWVDWDTPRYVISMASSAAFCVAATGMVWVLRYVLIRENRKIKQSDSEATSFYPY